MTARRDTQGPGAGESKRNHYRLGQVLKRVQAGSAISIKAGETVGSGFKIVGVSSSTSEITSKAHQHLDWLAGWLAETQPS